MSILISGKESPTSENIDVFLAPLLEELLTLWSGVPTLDTSGETGVETFLLRGMLLWTISDFPAYGLISGQQTKGFRACPICGPDLDSHTARGPKGEKVVYTGARRRLNPHHPLRFDKRVNGEVELRNASQRMSSAQVMQYAREREAYLAAGGRGNGPNDPVKDHGVKRLSALFQLPYWKVHIYCWWSTTCHCKNSL